LIGLSAVLDTDGALNVIGLTLRSPSLVTRALIFDIFGAVCFIPGGHAIILEAMDLLCDRAHKRFRFEMVLDSLWESCQDTKQEEKELQVIL
jgi:hypothetical protein